MKEAHDRHHVIGRYVLMDDVVRRDNADTNERTERGTWRAAFGESLQAPIESVKLRVITTGDIRARLCGKIAEDESGVGVRRRSEDDPRHYSLSAARHARRCAPCVPRG
jgi:hypothetical protein